MKRLAVKCAMALSVLGMAAAAPSTAGAGVINFESVPPSLFFPGDTFTDNVYTMTVDFDFGTVDSAGFLPAPTSGNSSQVYGQFNDGGLVVQRTDGLGFRLNSFDYALIPQTPAGPVPTAMIAYAEDMDGTQFGYGFAFAPAVAGANPFATANTVGLFNNLRWVEFFSCSLVGGQLCTAATNNSGQFALDNINTYELPEPTSVALVLGALLAVGLSARRKSA